ncbi:hypothetical protein SprV_0200759200 [Sparganum proliferum]
MRTGIDRVLTTGVDGGGVGVLLVCQDCVMCMLMGMADATAADVEAVEEEEEEEEEEGNCGSGRQSELFDGVGGEGEVDGETTVGAVRVLQLVRRCPISPVGARNVR